MLWYAVQSFDDVSWDFGSYDYEQAMELCEMEHNRHNGDEVRLLTIDEAKDECIDIEVIYEGANMPNEYWVYSDYMVDECQYSSRVYKDALNYAKNLRDKGHTGVEIAVVNNTDGDEVERTQIILRG